MIPKRGVATPVTATQIAQISRSDLDAVERYVRAADYLAAAQLCLRGNVRLREPLRSEHLKARAFGRWRSQPGINIVYAHLNRLILVAQVDVLLVLASEDGDSAVAANLFLEGSLAGIDPALRRDADGVERLIRAFSARPLRDTLPGLGYGLGHAVGAVLDDPPLIAACVLGGSEEEIDLSASAWSALRALDPANSGAVLPILCVEERDASTRGIFAEMNDVELQAFFGGYGYRLQIVSEDERGAVHVAMSGALDWAYREIRAVQKRAREGERVRPVWPMIALRIPAAWSSSYHLDTVRIAGGATGAKDVETLERWLRSYHPDELFDAEGGIDDEAFASCPVGDARIGSNPRVHRAERFRPLTLPDLGAYALAVERPGSRAEVFPHLYGYLDEVARDNAEPRCFRLLEGEVLGGYVATGRHGIAVGRASRLDCADAMAASGGRLRTGASLNCVTALDTRRLGFLDGMLTHADKQGGFHAYYACDGNTLLAATEAALSSSDRVNVLIGGARYTPHWLTLDEARAHLERGASIWRWAGTAGDELPDVVLAAAGEPATVEMMAAAALLRSKAPELRLRVVSVVDLLKLDPERSDGFSVSAFEEFFPDAVPVVFAFQGHPGVIRELIRKRPAAWRFQVCGLREDAAGATPFDLALRNAASRLHLACAAVRCVPWYTFRAEALAREWEHLLAAQRTFVDEEGDDPPEVREQRWEMST